PTYFYLDKGQLVSGWELSVGDNSNWYTPIKDRAGVSASGKISVLTTDFREQKDAIQFVWVKRKDTVGSVSISGAAIDLSAVEQSAGLVIDIKVDVAPDKDVSLGMSCGHPCQGQMQVGKLLKSLKKGEWMSLPIPISCFVKNGLDVKKISSPLTITTDGKLTLSVANVRVEKLNDDEKICNE
ncbi:MAG: glucan-glucohydrolase, partial [Proteobacteria bacterium]